MPGHVVLGADGSVRAVEPEPVFGHRSAEAGAMFHSRFTLFGAAQTPRAQLVGVVVGLQRSLEKFAARLPRKVLPPSFGMMLTRTPPSSDSADWAATSITISWMLPSVKLMVVMLSLSRLVIDMPLICSV